MREHDPLVWHRGQYRYKRETYVDGFQDCLLVVAVVVVVLCILFGFVFWAV